MNQRETDERRAELEKEEDSRYVRHMEWVASWPQHTGPNPSLDTSPIGYASWIMRYDGEFEVHEISPTRSHLGKTWKLIDRVKPGEPLYDRLLALFKLGAACGTDGGDPHVRMTGDEWRGLRRTLEEESGMGGEVAGGTGEG